ncbi:MAG: DNA mismatch repair protein MutS, partial [Deltaproteobacteria bacterium]|nr:DNA mismatch repair protein MutS [Deltaproteobacteria bacterium]
HGRLDARVLRARLLKAAAERGMARLDGRWHGFTRKGERFLSADHPYAPDLDLFGQGSLFQLLDETGTTAGEVRLAAWLSAPAEAAEVASRQEAVRELAPRLDFRQQLIAAGTEVTVAHMDPGPLRAWASGPDLLRGIRWARWLPFVLPPVTLSLWALGRQGLVPAWLYGPLLLLQLGVAVATRRPLVALHAAISPGEQAFQRFGPLFAAVEAQAFEGARLRTLLQPLGGTVRPSGALGRFGTLLSLAEVRRNQLGPALNLLLLWDVAAGFALERWRAAHGPEVDRWFDALAELEALCSLAGLAHDRPDHAFPVLVPEGPCFEAEGLGHLLLERPVCNDVQLSGRGSAWVVTGSNMSGKTTLLRAVGLNAVLALAGGPVCAASLELSPLQVLTSMRVKDSLERGVSYFYAEVQRLKLLLDAAAARPGQGLFLLDEILLGTNARERQLASREVLKLLLSHGAVGGVSTHDLALATLSEEPGSRVRNVHFRDEVVNGQMTFDYRLRDGVVDTTNALRVMRLAGVPV